MITIQRIENNGSEPRGKTLNLICDALQLDLSELTIIENEKLIGIGPKIINGFFLVTLNFVLMGIIGFFDFRQ